MTSVDCSPAGPAGAAAAAAAMLRLGWLVRPAWLRLWASSGLRAQGAGCAQVLLAAAAIAGQARAPPPKHALAVELLLNLLALLQQRSLQVRTHKAAP